MKAYSVDEVADTLIAMAREKRLIVLNLKLQKLMYYAQAWSLVFYGTPIFQEEFEAWVHGPVVPVLFRRFREYKWKPISENVSPKDVPIVRTHIDKILVGYGRFSANELERLSHSESPWKDARGALPPDEPSRTIITKTSMRRFYTRLHNESD